MIVYTVGHSTRTLDELIEILKIYKIARLIDVRSVPRSRHTPQFNKDTIGDNLVEHSIQYEHLAALGGLRSTNKSSINTGWRNKSFRGYADYMQTDEFAAGLESLLKIAKKDVVAIMCAEAVPWRCHRSMIGDALLVRDIKVIDIFDAKKTQDEKLTSFAEVKGTNIAYPAYDDDSSDDNEPKSYSA